MLMIVVMLVIEAVMTIGMGWDDDDGGGQNFFCNNDKLVIVMD